MRFGKRPEASQAFCVLRHSPTLKVQDASTNHSAMMVWPSNTIQKQVTIFQVWNPFVFDLNSCPRRITIHFLLNVQSDGRLVKMRWTFLGDCCLFKQWEWISGSSKLPKPICEQLELKALSLILDRGAVTACFWVAPSDNRAIFQDRSKCNFLWPWPAALSSADLGPESCHHYKQDCPMWQLHHLRCTTMQKPVGSLLVLPVPQQLWRCLRLAALQPGEVLMDHSVFAPLRWQAVENSLPKTPAPKSSSPLLWRTVELNSEARAATTGQRHGASVRHDPNTLEHLFNKSVFSATIFWKEHRANTPTTTLSFSSVGTKTTLEEIIPPRNSACDHQRFTWSSQNCSP